MRDGQDLRWDRRAPRRLDRPPADVLRRRGAAGDAGHINVWPKEPIETLGVLDEQTIAYLDLVGSGAETIAHLRENGRIVVMLCSFDGPPRRRAPARSRRGSSSPARVDFPDAAARCPSSTAR